jgi:hypothetical protein
MTAKLKFNIVTNTMLERVGVLEAALANKQCRRLTHVPRVCHHWKLASIPHFTFVRQYLVGWLVGSVSVRCRFGWACCVDCPHIPHCEHRREKLHCQRTAGMWQYSVPDSRESAESAGCERHTRTQWPWPKPMQRTLCRMMVNAEQTSPIHNYTHTHREREREQHNGHSIPMIEVGESQR